ncbi:MAG TPA: hypothetical protein VIR01_09080 [Pyrinomonadaceae bacterium]|jgi:hypothetical protein
MKREAWFIKIAVDHSRSITHPVLCGHKAPIIYFSIYHFPFPISHFSLAGSFTNTHVQKSDGQSGNDAASEKWEMENDI